MPAKAAVVPTKTVDGKDAHLACETTPVDLTNKASIQRGASLFMSYCAGCHSAQYVRYSKCIKTWTFQKELVEKILMLTTDQVGDHINAGVDPELPQKRCAQPPDLSRWNPSFVVILGLYLLVSLLWRSKSSLGCQQYQYCRIFAMPFILHDMQMNTSKKNIVNNIGDIVNFMAWMAEPQAHQRKVLWFWSFFLLALLISSVLTQ